MIHTPRLHLGSAPRSLAALAATVLLFALVPLAGTAFARDGEIIVTEGDGLVTSIRYAGEDRFDTSELIATEPTGFGATFSGEAVILARADAFPDALAGSTLAGLVAAPIVLTPADTAADEGDLNEDTAEALDFYDPATIYILGGPEAIGTDVEDEVEADYPDAEVIRIGGENRFETAALIADQAESATAAADVPTAIVARGGDFADALVAGSIAAAEGMPLLLTGSQGTLDPYAADRLEDLGIERVLLAGGPAAISTDIEDEIAEIVDVVDRIAGEERLETAAEFAELAVAEFGFSTTHVNLAFGFNFPDALALGAHAGLDFEGPSPILLTESDSLGDATAGFLADIASPDFEAVHIAGGYEAVPQSVEDEAREILTVEDEPSTLTLTPETATNFVNETHEVTATLLDNGMTGIAGADVTFTFEETATTGLPESMTVATDDDGAASVSFTSSTPGEVTITATTSDSDGEELTASAQKTFVLPTLTAYAFDTTSDELITFDAVTGEGAETDDDPTTDGVALGGDFNPGTGVAGMDVRPATGVLYLLGTDGQLYTVDPDTGLATDVGTPITSSGGPYALGAGAAFDFNPVVDRIRVVLPDNTNLVLNPEPDATTDAIEVTEQADVAYVPPIADPAVTAAAYSNAVAATTAASTTLYVMDTDLDILATQSATDPTTGQLTPVGALETEATEVNGFDIFSPTAGRNIGFAALSDGTATSVVTVDLMTGVATEVHTLEGSTLEAFTLAPQEVAEFTVALAGAFEEPEPNTTGANGTAVVRIDEVGGLVCSVITVDKGTATGTFAGSPGAHIHEAGPDEVGPVVLPLTPPDDITGTGAGCSFEDPALAAEIAATPENYYVNVHTTDFPAGLVRGQMDNDNDGDGTADA